MFFLMDRIKARARIMRRLEFAAVEFEHAAPDAPWRSVVDPGRRCEAEAC
jgi:hypothetical protein